MFSCLFIQLPAYYAVTTVFLLSFSMLWLLYFEISISNGNLHPGEVGQPKLIRSHNGVRVSGSHGAPAESVCTALTVFLTGSVLLRRYTHGLGRSVVRTSTVYHTVPFVKSVYAGPITELDGNCNVRLEDGVAVLVPLARIKRTETVSVLLDCFCCACSMHPAGLQLQFGTVLTTCRCMFLSVLF